MSNKAVIDIGSNSIRMLIYRINEDKSFFAIHKEKRSTKLGKHIENNKLTEVGIYLTISTLKAFKVLCNNYNVQEIHVFATEAIRKSENNDFILKKVYRETGLNIKILSGEEEAYLGFLAVSSSIEHNNYLLLDLGGASLEITHVENNIMKNTISLPLGSIPLTYNFNNLMTKDDKINLINYLINKFSDIPWLKSCKGLPIIGIGGAIRAIGTVNKKLTSNPMEMLNNYVLTSNDLKNIYSILENHSFNEHHILNVLTKSRADIFIAPLATILFLMNYISCKELVVGDFDIKDGFIANEIFKGKPINILNYSIKNITHRNKLNYYNNLKVYNLSNEIYLTLGNEKKYNKLLFASSMLYSIGEKISITPNADYCFHSIIYSNINGLSHKEIMMTATICALVWDMNYIIPLDYQRFLSKKDMLCCKQLALILYISDTLIKFSNKNNESILMNLMNDSLLIYLPSNELNCFEYIQNKISSSCIENFTAFFNKYLQIKALN